MPVAYVFQRHEQIARLQGAGRLAFLGLAVYDIRLWVGEGFSAETFAQRPLAIEIEYARSLWYSNRSSRSPIACTN